MNDATENPRNVAIYARISDDAKRIKSGEGGLSVEQQVRDCQAYAERVSLSVSEIYVDNDITATKKVERPQFERMLLDAPELVIVAHQDRLERDTGDLERVMFSGIQGVTSGGTKISFDTADEELMARLRSTLAIHEGKLKAERIRRASRRNAFNGKYRGSIRPFGQTLKGDWVQPEADAVIEAAEKLASNEWTFFKVSKVWNDAGLKTPLSKREGSAKGQGGNEWTAGTVKQYFGRPRLKGYQEYNGTLYKLSDWTPLLSEELFDAIQERIQRERKDSSGRAPIRVTTHLLTNICVCSACGRGANVGYRGGAGSKKYYRCPTTGHGTVTAPPMEEAVSRYTIALLSQHAELKAESENVIQQRTTLQKKRNKLIAEHEAWVDDALASKMKASRIAKAEELHDAELEAIDAELLELDANRFSTIFRESTNRTGKGKWDYATTIDLSGWEELEIQKRRELLQTLFTSIEITKSERGKRFSEEANLKYNHTALGRKLHDALIDSFMDATDERHLK
ncbi:recombinase family protein [Glutamicibacter sp. NPDC087661]|uniref:recombinase family protein n=1 Tax=Glutamicibacter sp. NPDC087661 TaxID=3363996 RepID=UPI003806306D